MSQLGGHVGATGSVSDVTVKHRVRTFLKNMGYSAELVDEAIKNCRDADHCVQYLDARAPKQTTGKQPLLTPFAQQKRDDLRRQLQSRGCKDAHIKIAVANCKIDAMSSGQAFSECYRLIEEELVPVDNLSLRESEAPSPTAVASNWKEKVASPALANRAQLKHMGYTDEQIDTAVTQGYGDLDSCVKYLISLESSAGQQPTPLTSAQTTTTPNPAFAAKGSVASSLASSQSDTGVSSDGTLLVNHPALSLHVPSRNPSTITVTPRRFTTAGSTKLPTRAKLPQQNTRKMDWALFMYLLNGSYATMITMWVSSVASMGGVPTRSRWLMAVSVQLPHAWRP
jgi:hypothetical protein